MGHRLLRSIGEETRSLAPASFALVMATGIVSIACHLFGFEFPAFLLFYLNIFSYVVLGFFTLGRLFFFPSRFLEDLSTQESSSGLLTLVAGTNVLGSQFALLSSNLEVAFILWIVGLILWIGLDYSLFTILILQRRKPPPEASLNGSWLLTVVSTQSIVVLGTPILPRFSPANEVFPFILLGFYLAGCMIYLLVISWILHRFIFGQTGPEDLVPSNWINMGAAAITTLAGASLLLGAHPAFFNGLLPFLKGLTIFFWAFATWWIPLLIILEVWRYFVRRFPLTYQTAFWGMVFPLGMYTACTIQLSQALDLPFLLAIPRVSIYVALLAWIAAFLGMVWSLIQRITKRGIVESFEEKLK